MIRVMGLIVVALATGCVTPSLSKLENSIIYQPVKSQQLSEFETAFRESKTPSDFKDVEIVSSRMLVSHWDRHDVHLHGWLAEARKPQAVVLYCHGNGGNVENCADILRLLRDKLNVTVLAFDYCGYGRSDEANLCESTLYQDARAARAWLAKHTGVKEQDIILFGYSLGGAVAVELAAKDGARGLILDRTFTSVPDVASHMIPILPVRWLMESKYDSLSKIKNYYGPLLQLHGEEDRVVPYELGKKLFDAANQPKEFVAMYDTGHNDPHDAEAIRALDFFFDELDPSNIGCGLAIAGATKPRDPGFFRRR